MPYVICFGSLGSFINVLYTLSLKPPGKEVAQVSSARVVLEDTFVRPCMMTRPLAELIVVSIPGACQCRGVSGDTKLYENSCRISWIRPPVKRYLFHRFGRTLE